MGCDIHFFIERRNSNTEPWYPIKTQSLVNVYADRDEWSPMPQPLALLNSFGSDIDYRDRNYDLFGILANVRNGIGFAGAKTSEGFVPISPPKGIPYDATEAYKASVKQWNGDGHSHSFLTVQELLDYDWNQTTKKEGYVTQQGWDHHRSGMEIHSYWTERITGLTIISNKAMDRKKEELPELISKEYVTYLKWEVSYKRSAGFFTERTIPALQQLGDPENVRTLFFFDN